MSTGDAKLYVPMVSLNIYPDLASNANGKIGLLAGRGSRYCLIRALDESSTLMQ